MKIDLNLSPAMGDEIIRLTQDLVCYESLSGHEKAIARSIETTLRLMDFDEIYIDEYGSVVALRRGALPGKRILFDAHMDVVPVNDLSDWTKDPFGGELYDGKIWGRGATDIKGGLAAMLVTLGRLPREIIPGTLILSASVGEELIEGAALKNVIEHTHPDGVVIIEPTMGKLGIGQKGRTGFWINVKGKPAHTSNPEMGENAIYKAVEIIQKLREMPLPVDEHLGKGVMELIEIRSTPFPGESIVPYGCTLRFERRLVSEETTRTVGESVDEALSTTVGWQMVFNETHYMAYTGQTIHYQEYHPGWVIDRSSPWVKKAEEGLKKVNCAAEFTTIPYCTNGSYAAGVLKLPTVVFGPSTIKLAHGINEYVNVDELLRTSQGMIGLGVSLGEFEQ
jgi:putative selenium metabolism hydrolase